MPFATASCIPLTALNSRASRFASSTLIVMRKVIFLDNDLFVVEVVSREVFITHQSASVDEGRTHRL
jgi:hypothetical protein